jgi:hypothetical protein
VDVLVVVARGPGDTVVTFLLDAVPQPGLSVSPAHLTAINATQTVRLGFAALKLGNDRLLAQESYEAARSSGERLRLNGSLALGLTKRCCRLIGPSMLDDHLARCRDRLDTADDAEMPSARAAACELAVRAAHALAVTRGSTSALAGDVADRLSREAGLLLVFGTRPAIKGALLAQFDATPRA